MHRADDGKGPAAVLVTDRMDFSQGGDGVPVLLLADVVLKGIEYYLLYRSLPAVLATRSLRYCGWHDVSQRPSMGTVTVWGCICVSFYEYLTVRRPIMLSAKAGDVGIHDESSNRWSPSSKASNNAVDEQM